MDSPDAGRAAQGVEVDEVLLGAELGALEADSRLPTRGWRPLEQQAVGAPGSFSLAAVVKLEQVGLLCARSGARHQPDAKVPIRRRFLGHRLARLQ